MAYDPGAIDATLAAAVGDEPALIAELRAAFLDSVRHGLAALEASHGDAAWREAAFRLRGLAASFGAVRLMAIATEAAEAEAQDAALLRRLRRAVERL
jgi:histidine phosphotransfer protein HptB